MGPPINEHTKCTLSLTTEQIVLCEHYRSET